MNEQALDQAVLVLNRNWQPVQTCSARRAVHLLSVGHARVVQEEGEEKYETHDFHSWLSYSQRAPSAVMIRSVRVSIRVPKILVLAFYDKIPSKEITFSRRNVFWRDQFTCQYCLKSFAESELNLDHVIPRKKGGKTTWDNIVTSCVKCNSRKGSQLPHEVNMHPKNKPVAPRWKPDYSIRMQSFDVAWEDFLSPSRDRFGLAG
jgi:5-methylcytosine-specific restriction endonuclease McrA